VAGKSSARSKHFSVSQEIQDELVEDIEGFLQQAYAIGQQHGQAMLPVERAISLSSPRNLLDRAKSIVSGIIDHVQDAISKALDRGDEQDSDLSQADIIDMTMNDLIDSMPELIAETETVGIVEGAVLDTLKDGGVAQVQWVADPDACEECQQLAESDPVDVGSDFLGGIDGPPMHPRCRCNVVPV
jgi:hypothetical protein